MQVMLANKNFSLLYMTSPGLTGNQLDSSNDKSRNFQCFQIEYVVHFETVGVQALDVTIYLKSCTCHN